jgi:regulator of RNase E activity RraA
MTATAQSFDILRRVTTATITTMLLKKGIRRCWMSGPMPLTPSGERLVGPAFTLRFVPVREDLATPESWGNPISTRAAIEEMPAGCVAVADATGVTSAGIFGDILTARMMKRGVTALVTDGAVRDKAGVLASRLPVWCAGVAAPASVNGLTFVGSRSRAAAARSFRATSSSSTKTAPSSFRKTWSNSSHMRAPNTNSMRAGS